MNEQRHALCMRRHRYIESMYLMHLVDRLVPVRTTATLNWSVTNYMMPNL